MTLSTQIQPIEDIKADVIVALNQYQTLLLTAPPGAGKSTCLPLWLLDLPCLSSKKIYLLQPRRLAAKNIACYLSKQLGENVGETVGYRLRNESKISKKNRLEVITEGILTQIIQHEVVTGIEVWRDQRCRRNIRFDTHYQQCICWLPEVFV